jgi:hypothetical protein
MEAPPGELGWWWAPRDATTGRYHDVKQGSPEWLQRRQTFVCTGSEFAAAAGIEGAGQSRMALWERKTGKKEEEGDRESVVAAACKHWGTTHEAEAREVLALVIPGVRTIREVGLYELPNDSRFATSPDGMVEFLMVGSSDEPCEIKCPAVRTAAQPPTEVQMCQLLAHMKATSRSRCHFFNYHPSEVSEYHQVPFMERDWDLLYKHLCEFATFVEKEERPVRLSRLRHLPQYREWLRKLSKNK